MQRWRWQVGHLPADASPHSTQVGIGYTVGCGMRHTPIVSASTAEYNSAPMRGSIRRATSRARSVCYNASARGRTRIDIGAEEGKRHGGGAAYGDCLTLGRSGFFDRAGIGCGTRIRALRTLLPLWPAACARAGGLLAAPPSFLLPPAPNSLSTTRSLSWSAPSFPLTFP